MSQADLKDIYDGNITEPWLEGPTQGHGAASGVIIGIFKERGTLYLDTNPCRKTLLAFPTDVTPSKTGEFCTCTGKSGKEHKLPVYAVTATQ